MNLAKIKINALLSAEWDSYFGRFPPESKDIYFTEDYSRLYQDADNISECFIYEKGQDLFLLPYLKRRVKILGGDYFDIETPYGYGGPLVRSQSSEFVAEAVDNFYYLAEENEIIAGFIRFHPLLNNHKILTNRCQVILDRRTVVMNLDLGYEAIWQEQIHPKHRNSIKKAQKLGFSYKVDCDLEYLDVFVEIYKATMRRIGADKFYYFSEKYFSSLRSLKRNIFLGLVFYQDKVISAALFFKYGIFGHYHLAGTLEEYRDSAANNFLIYNTALWMKENKVRFFHLGGGSTRESNNSLFRFKRRFSQEERSFYIGKIIFNQQVYRKACDIWEDKFPHKKEERFLKYWY